MHDRLKVTARNVIVMSINEDGEQHVEGNANEHGESGVEQVVLPSSGTRLKQQKKIAQASLTSFMVSGLVKPQT
jgi:hypothetical protein